MLNESKTLGEFLSDPRIALIADDAIRNMDLRQEPIWHKTISELRNEHFGGGILPGFERLFEAAQQGNWFFPVYSDEECAADASRRSVNLVFLPSKAEDAGNRPYIFLVPGGGFVNVWNLTEGWPVAAQFNELGYHVFILTYRVQIEDKVLDREMEDFAHALSLIRQHEDIFPVQADHYITCGFSAGGYLVCLWNVKEKGYEAYHLPKPSAVFPVYPLVSWKLCMQHNGFDPGDAERLFGCDMARAADSPYEIPDHAENFPPCALFLAAGDTLVSPEHSRMLKRSLDTLGIPCRLEIGKEGGHGFADGSWTCMEGWTERAVRWYETVAKKS